MKVTETTAMTLKRFKKWLTNSRHFLFSWYTKDSKETQEPQQTLIELPSKVREKLVETIENLPSNAADKKAITSILDATFTLWRKDPSNANNSVVILSSPVTAVSRILSETLQEWAEQKQVSITLLPFTARPEAIETIQSKLEHYLERKSTTNDLETQGLEVVVIPNLSWCFLRSLEGLEGIDYLRSLLCDGSQNRFWIIGAGQVSWEYLHFICDLDAYCGEVFTLPAIASEDLQEWLAPILEGLDIVYDAPRIDQQILDGDQDNQTNYFERLADSSQGISTVAVQLLLKSINQQQIEKEDETKPRQNILVAQTPKLPELPSLQPVEQYLLYSLLLHGDLTIPALAESLGDEDGTVQARVQVLRRRGVVEQRNEVLKINPMYYPIVKQQLSSNNFVIDRESS